MGGGARAQLFFRTHTSQTTVFDTVKYTMDTQGVSCCSTRVTYTMDWGGAEFHPQTLPRLITGSAQEHVLSAQDLSIVLNHYKR